MVINDLIIAVSYFSIPIQISVSLYRYPHISSLPRRLVVVLVLFVLFIALCGLGHLSRCLGYGDSPYFFVLNTLTAIVSFMTALYLPPQSLDGVENFIKLNEETAESKRKLMTFMAFLCHEIRNPLFAITSSISFVEDDPMTNEQEKGMSAIKQSAGLMLRLVNDVLDISKLESGKLELDHHNFDLHRLLDGLVTSSLHDAKQKSKDKVVFRSTIAPDVPRDVMGDSVRIQQIAGNLLSNATKFTESGSVEFAVSVVDEMPPKETPTETEESSYNNNNSFEHRRLLSSTAEDSDTNEVPKGSIILKLCVTDTGIGIAPEMLERIFEPYSQAKLKNYRKHGGTGLGLSIVSKLTYLIGGVLQVDSKLGEGSKFTVYLPVCKDDSNNANDTDDDVLKDSKVPPCTENTACDVASDRRDHSTVDLESGLLAGQPSSELALPVAAKATTPTEETPPPPPKVLTASSSPPKKRGKLPPLDFPTDKNNMVLVVDDNAVNRKILGKMLTQFNVQHSYACDGQEAVDAIKASRNYTGNPDDPSYGLVLMDLCMPVLDGLQATQQIRNGLNLRDLPIMALTANAINQRRDEAFEAGVTEFATKPILRPDLYSKCEQYLRP